MVAELRITQGLCSRIPAAENYFISPSDSVRFFRKTDRKIHGPYNVLKVEDKQVFIDRGETIVQHNLQ